LVSAVVIVVPLAFIVLRAIRDARRKSAEP
jgi:hypothetical protein